MSKKWLEVDGPDGVRSYRWTEDTRRRFNLDLIDVQALEHGDLVYVDEECLSLEDEPWPTGDVA